MKDLFTELKRRKVFRVSVVYVATGFVILEAADIMLPRLGVPEWAMSLMVVLVVLGFPLALVLAWALELTPDGVRVTPSTVEPDPSEPNPSRLGKRTVFAAGGLVVLGLGLGAGWLLRPMATPAADAVPTLATAPSIAVLPFVNMSASAENEYFSDGISEELLNLLARVPGLQVAARTSSFAFKGRSEDASEIARQLRVGHILEGSVRRAGDRVRITAQLIEADQGYHLWSQAYDRELADIFLVQDEIARAIVAALETHLGLGAGSELARTAATHDPRAHDLYLVGLRDWHRRGDANLHAALERFREAARIDPDYAAAHAGMAITYAVLPYYGDFSVDEAVREGKAAAERSLELRPDLAEAHAALGAIAQNWEWDWAGAERDYDRALELSPSYATAHMWRCELFSVLGRHEEAIRACRTGLELDPLAPIAHHQMGSALMWSNRQDAARTSYRRALELDPTLRTTTANLAYTYLLARDYDGWLPMAQQLAASAEERRFNDVLHAGVSRPLDASAKRAALSAIEAVRREAGDPYHKLSIPFFLYVMGEHERSLDALEANLAVPHLRVHMSYGAHALLFGELVDHPRFRAVLRRMDLSAVPVRPAL